MREKVTLTILRHSKKDRNGNLTTEGEALAKQCRARLGNPHFDAGFCSSLEKTAKTLQIVAGTKAIPMTVLPELLHDTNEFEGQYMEEIFGLLGNVSIAEYLTYGETAREVFIGFGAKEWLALTKNLGDATDIIVVGHGILLEFMVLAASKSASLNMHFNECEGAQLVLENGRCTSIKILHNG